MACSCIGELGDACAECHAPIRDNWPDNWLAIELGLTANEPEHARASAPNSNANDYHQDRNARARPAASGQ